MVHVSLEERIHNPSENRKIIPLTLSALAVGGLGLLYILPLGDRENDSVLDLPQRPVAEQQVTDFYGMDSSLNYEALPPRYEVVAYSRGINENN